MYYVEERIWFRYVAFLCNMYMYAQMLTSFCLMPNTLFMTWNTVSNWPLGNCFKPNNLSWHAAQVFQSISLGTY